jgi:hypothetical protein
MEDQKRSNPIDCPDLNRWLAIASGLETSEVAESLCGHAAGCDQCGPRLKEALLLLADDEDPVEDRFVASLKSSQPAWQENLAERLAAPEREMRPEAGMVAKAKFGWFSMRWRFAAVCMAALLGLGVFWMVNQRQHRDLAAPRVSMVANPAKVSPPSTGADLPKQIEPPAVLVASLILEPGLTRGSDRIPVLELANEIKSVSVTLLFLDAPPEKLRVELLNSKRESVWTRNVDVTDAQVSRRRVKVSIPASVMRSDDYQILANERGEGGTENVASYSYRVKR